jgi:hypothetical protein
MFPPIPVAAALLPPAVLVTVARNWLYLITVAYKISRRLALLAPAPLPARLSGAALTFIGMFLGLWQSLSYTAIDAAFYVVLYKLVCFTLPQSSLAAVLAWRAWVFVPNYAVFRFAKEAWHRGKTAFKEARLLVLAPQVLLVNNQALVSWGWCCFQVESVLGLVLFPKLKSASDVESGVVTRVQGGLLSRL